MAEPVMLVRDCVALLELDRERQLAQLAVLKNRVRVGQRRVGIVDFFRLPAKPSIAAQVQPTKWYWDVWAVAQDTTAFGGGPTWTKIAATGESWQQFGPQVGTSCLYPCNKSILCNWLANLPGAYMWTPDADGFTLSNNPQFVRVYVIQKALNNSSIVGTWAGYLPQVLAQMGCP